METAVWKCEGEGLWGGVSGGHIVFFTELAPRTASRQWRSEQIGE